MSCLEFGVENFILVLKVLYFYHLAPVILKIYILVPNIILFTFQSIDIKRGKNKPSRKFKNKKIVG